MSEILYTIKSIHHSTGETFCLGTLQDSNVVALLSEDGCKAVNALWQINGGKYIDEVDLDKLNIKRYDTDLCLWGNDELENEEVQLANCGNEFSTWKYDEDDLTLYSNDDCMGGESAGEGVEMHDRYDVGWSGWTCESENTRWKFVNICDDDVWKDDDFYITHCEKDKRDKYYFDVEIKDYVFDELDIIDNAVEKVGVVDNAELRNCANGVTMSREVNLEQEETYTQSMTFQESFTTSFSQSFAVGFELTVTAEASALFVGQEASATARFDSTTEFSTESTRESGRSIEQARTIGISYSNSIELDPETCIESFSFVEVTKDPVEKQFRATAYVTALNGKNGTQVTERDALLGIVDNLGKGTIKNGKIIYEVAGSFSGYYSSQQVSGTNNCDCNDPVFTSTTPTYFNTGSFGGSVARQRTEEILGNGQKRYINMGSVARIRGSARTVKKADKNFNDLFKNMN